MWKLKTWDAGEFIEPERADFRLKILQKTPFGRRASYTPGPPGGAHIPFRVTDPPPFKRAALCCKGKGNRYISLPLLQRKGCQGSGKDQWLKWSARSGGGSLPLPSRPLPLLPPLPSLSASPPLRSRTPLLRLGSGGALKLPQQGLGQSPSRNWIWCILALKSDIWWQQILWFLW